MSCVFCKILKKEILAEIIYEDDNLLAFKDIHPLAPIHILIIPKKHIESVNELTDKDIFLAGRMIIVAKKLAQKMKIKKRGYKLLIRVGADGGQEVPHLHLHILGGAKLSEGIHPVR